MSTPAPSGCRPAALVFCRQPRVGKRIDERHSFRAMIQRPLHFVDIAVFSHQFYRENLPCRMGPHILRDTKRLCGPLHIFPNGLTRPVFFGVPARKDPLFPRVFFEVR